MTKGVLIYAFNNGEIDYLAMAKWSQKRIKRLLGLDTTIISNAEQQATSGGTRTFNSKISPWLNASRCNAWEDSPYDETIVLDADYIVNSNTLLKLFDTKQDFLIHQTVSDVTAQNHFNGQKSFGELHFPQSWATVFYFNRAKNNQLIFETVRMIKENYTHYANLYKFPRMPFRNDFAFSIALGMLNGHTITDNNGIKWPLTTASTNVVVSVEDDTIKLEYEKNNKHMRLEIADLDLHVMNKKAMEEICASS
jgi:hypothetical protein